MDDWRFDNLWTADLKELAKSLQEGQPGSDHFELRRAVIDAKLTSATIVMSRWTMGLAISTFVLALATVALVIVTACGD